MKKNTYYSLAEKRSYYANRLDVLSAKKSLSKSEEQKLRYAQGFLLASKNAKLSHDINKLDYSNQLGQINGFKARKNNK